MNINMGICGAYFKSSGQVGIWDRDRSSLLDPRAKGCTEPLNASPSSSSSSVSRYLCPLFYRGTAMRGDGGGMGGGSRMKRVGGGIIPPKKGTTLRYNCQYLCYATFVRDRWI